MKKMFLDIIAWAVVVTFALLVLWGLISMAIKDPTGTLLGIAFVGTLMLVSWSLVRILG